MSVRRTLLRNQMKNYIGSNNIRWGWRKWQQEKYAEKYGKRLGEIILGHLRYMCRGRRAAQ